MSLEYRDANLLYRIIRRTAGWRPLVTIYSVIQHRVDRLLYRLSRGRWTLSSLLSGMPIIMLTTTGAKTGQARTLPVVGLPYGDDIAVIASNFGKLHHPAWYFNLRAHPEAAIAVGGGPTRTVRARPVLEDERTEIWQTAVRIYPTWAAYEKRCGDRVIPILVLESAR